MNKFSSSSSKAANLEPPSFKNPLTRKAVGPDEVSIRVATKKKSQTKKDDEDVVVAQEGQNNAKKRVHERKLKEQQERQLELLRDSSTSRRRHSDITAEEGRARAQARVRLRQLQKKAAILEGQSADDDSVVSRISIQVIMRNLDMDTQSCRSYLLADDDHSVASKRSLTIPVPPKFLLDVKYGEKGSPRCAHKAHTGFAEESEDVCFLAQSNDFFVESLRGDDEFSWYEGRVTVPRPPAFHTSKINRPAPKSTEARDLEIIQQHQFKARPLPPNIKKQPDIVPKTTKRKPLASDFPSLKTRAAGKKSTVPAQIDTKKKQVSYSAGQHLSEARRVAKGLQSTE